MKNQKPLIIIPIETKARELKSRLLIAAKAKINGYKIIFGTSRILHRQLHKFPKGVIIENDVTLHS